MLEQLLSIAHQMMSSEQPLAASCASDSGFPHAYNKSLAFLTTLSPGLFLVWHIRVQLTPALLSTPVIDNQHNQTDSETMDLTLRAWPCRQPFCIHQFQAFRSLAVLDRIMCSRQSDLGSLKWASSGNGRSICMARCRS